MAHRRRGGQWVELDPELSEPMLKIVQILRELVDCSGLRLKGVQQLLLAEHQSGPRPPSYHGLSQRLRGEGLQNNAWLIHLIIETLAPQERKEVLTAEVSQHLLDARAVRMAGAAQAQQKPTQETATPELLDVLRENRELHKEAEQLRRRLERKDKDLRALRHKLAAAETRVPSPALQPPPAPHRTCGRTGSMAYLRTRCPYPCVQRALISKLMPSSPLVDAAPPTPACGRSRAPCGGCRTSGS